MKITRSKVSIGSAESKAAIAVETTFEQLIQERIRDLRENTNYISTLLDSLIGYAIISADFDGNIIAYNEGARQIYGYAPEEVVGKQSIDIFFPREFLEAGKLQQVVSDLIEKGRFFYEGEKIRKNGEGFPAQILFTLTKDKSGKVVGFIEMVEDLTERKQIEKQLLDNMTNFIKVVNSSADGIIVTSREGIVKFSNPAAELLFGKTSEELKGTQFGFPVQSVDKTEIDIMRKTGEPVVAEMRVVETVWYDEMAYLASIRDVTERKKTEENTKRAAQQWRTTFDSISDFVSIHDRDFRIVRANRSLSNLFKMEPREVIGRYCYELLHGSSGPCSECPYIRTMETKMPATLESFHDGWGIYIEITTSPIFNEIGEVINCVHIVRDITERKKAQLARERLNYKLQVKVSELETFSYGIAHDLRSPLISVEGLIRFLREDMLKHDDDATMVQEDIRLLESAVRKMRDFLNGTLVYSRAGQLVKRIKDVSFGKIVNAVLKELNTEISLIGATVSVADEFPSVYADESRITQVLTNLIQNSIKYRDKTVPLKIEIGYRLSECEIVFFVCDNGLGIDESDVGKVFDLFYRGTAEGEGSGIGLSIVKKIIEAHGGRIWVEQGQSGKGTTMCFTLPQQNGTNEEDNNGKD
jgi:PAS domain S-box-containing protein